jgi:hypothetical protein
MIPENGLDFYPDPAPTPNFAALRLIILWVLGVLSLVIWCVFHAIA